jgi:hypothetical protein
MKDNLNGGGVVYGIKKNSIEKVGGRKKGTGCGQVSFLKRTYAGLAARLRRALVLWWRVYTFFQGVAEGLS